MFWGQGLHCGVAVFMVARVWGVVGLCGNVTDHALEKQGIGKVLVNFSYLSFICSLYFNSDANI